MFTTSRPKDLFLSKMSQAFLWFRISSIDIAWDYSREHRWDLITFGSILFWESLSVSLCLKYLVHSFKWRVEPGVWEIVFSSCSRGNCIFFFGIFWFMYHSLDKRVWLSITFLPLKQNLTLFQIWISFAIPSLFLVWLGVIKNRVTKVKSKYFNGNFDYFICTGWSILFLYTPDHQA